MKWDIDSIEKKLSEELTLNANKDQIDVCYHKCADKSKIKELYDCNSHQVIYGRRGTGKTTLLKSLCYYANNVVSSNGIRCIYVDMENIVPNLTEFKENNVNDYTIEIHRLLCDTIIHKLIDIYENETNKHITYKKRESDKIDRLSAELLELTSKKELQATIKTIEEEEILSNSQEGEITAGIQRGRIGFLSRLYKRKNNINKTQTSKEICYVLNIKKIKDNLEELLRMLKYQRVIICIDEFTRIDKGREDSVQTSVAQLIKDTFFRLTKVTVKITSLWNKSRMQMRQLSGPRHGIELGEDIAKSFDLDTIFFAQEYAFTFFLDLIINVCLLGVKDEYNDNEKENLRTFILTKLFKNKEVFRLLICGSQGVPRIFRNILIEAIKNRQNNRDKTITANNLYDCIKHNYTDEVRRKLNYEETPLISLIDDFVLEHKHRFILLKNSDYKDNIKDIEGLVDNNYMHQYPSERVDRKYRNKYKFYLIHYGNYLEAIEYKDFRSQSLSNLLYPSIPSNFEDVISEYLITISNSSNEGLV